MWSGEAGAGGHRQVGGMQVLRTAESVVRLVIFVTLAAGLWVFWGKPSPEAIVEDVVRVFTTIWSGVFS